MPRTHTLSALVARFLVMSGLALFDVQAGTADAAPASEKPSSLERRTSL